MKTKEEAVRGRPVSGRSWKKVETSRKSSMIDNKMLKPGWAKQQELRKERQIVKTMESEIKARKTAEKEALKVQRAANIKRKEENNRRAEILVQVSASKIKHLSKKKLRGIRKVSAASIAKK
ncbi:hypothetical protein SmJEL517_g03098 [Synchytrium microbalum]|uniref:rRNA-processing protein n=1 Tax=Synchytrium microbalum TaxID=1806994 RepID=A0A507C4W9_9FUNG|nr:uncharacterized protein SmJEL517_g03098 [Synchytrium microbalum]TPX34159.1 hypothetical protein SmJEL517_g03098 [Synchytrium microbalum]